MDSFFESWGLTLNQTLFLLAIICMVLDFFVGTDILSHVAYIIFSFLIARNVPFHFMYKVLIGLVAWFAIICCHYLFFKRFVQQIVNRIIAPDKYREGADGLVNKIGEVKEVEQKKMVMIDGDLWPAEAAEDLQVGQKVKVTNAKDGILTVEQAEREC
jgi:membrane protein implicated in regulation of membrane protease activity